MAAQLADPDLANDAVQFMELQVGWVGGYKVRGEWAWSQAVGGWVGGSLCCVGMVLGGGWGKVLVSV